MFTELALGLFFTFLNVSSGLPMHYPQQTLANTENALVNRVRGNLLRHGLSRGQAATFHNHDEEQRSSRTAEEAGYGSMHDETQTSIQTGNQDDIKPPKTI